MTSDYWRPPGPPSIPHGAAELRLPPEDTCCSQLLQAAATGVTAPIISTNQLFPIEGFSSSTFWILDLSQDTCGPPLLQIAIVALSHQEQTSPSYEKGTFVHIFMFYFHTLASGPQLLLDFYFLAQSTHVRFVVKHLVTLVIPIKICPLFIDLG